MKKLVTLLLLLVAVVAVAAQDADVLVDEFAGDTFVSGEEAAFAEDGQFATVGFAVQPGAGEGVPIDLAGWIGNALLLIAVILLWYIYQSVRRR